MTHEFVTRTPYRYAVGLMIKTVEVSGQVCRYHMKYPAAAGLFVGCEGAMKGRERVIRRKR
jgi:hypothetical protein